MSESWWLNPFSWVDESDLFEGERVTLHKAIAALTDTMVQRPVDKDVMVRGLRGAMATGKLTQRQETALTIARAAAEAGVTATAAVSAALKINRFSAYKLLQRVDGRLGNSAPPKMETSGEFFHIDNIRVSEAAIKREMLASTVECAACGKPGCSVRYALCRPCFEKYGATGERLGRTELWLDPLIRQTQAQARKDAIARLYRAEWREYGEAV